jgi:hypothetical protein
VTKSLNKVFCLGLSRTGTTSLFHALRDLGLRPFHYPLPLFASPEILGIPPFRPALRLNPYASWRRGKELKAARVLHNLRELLERHDVFTDLPVPLYFRELDQMFPESKFLLTTRAVEPWLKSMEWLFNEGGVLWRRGHLGDELHLAVYGTSTFDREKLLAAWNRHHETIRAYFKNRSADFMEIAVDRGEMSYETLESFLGLEPTGLRGPCPRVNESQAVPPAQVRSHRLQRLLEPALLLLRKILNRARP